MATVLGNLFGGPKEAESPAPASPAADSDFADFADVPDPSPEPMPAGADRPAVVGPGLGGDGPPAAPSPTAAPFDYYYTKWYNVHERHSLSEFRTEGIILLALAVLALFHLAGSRANRSKARAWTRAHAPVFRREFSLVGLGAATTPPPAAEGDNNDDTLLRQKSLFEFVTYATGRQNVAFVDVRLTLARRFNPLVHVAEVVAGYFLDSYESPRDVAEVISYPFDGQEAAMVPPASRLPGAAELQAAAKDASSSSSGSSSSAYDGFVFGVVNKAWMQRVREERYDASISLTKDHPKLPVWAVVMTESAEITDAILTDELVQAVESAGELLEFLLISDQPTERPKSVDHAVPRKRIWLRYRLPPDGNYESLLPLFNYFVRLPDVLVRVARFRPEVLRKLKTVREELVARIRQQEESVLAEERASERDKTKKAKRDQALKGLDAKAQKKFLEKERGKEMRKGQKKMRG